MSSRSSGTVFPTSFEEEGGRERERLSERVRETERRIQENQGHFEYLRERRDSLDTRRARPSYRRAGSSRSDPIPLLLRRPRSRQIRRAVRGHGRPHFPTRLARPFFSRRSRATTTRAVFVAIHDAPRDCGLCTD